MFKGPGLVSLAALLAGCSSLTSVLCNDQDILYVLVQTKPDGATVTFADGSACETPCRVGVIESVDMTIGRTGYKAEKLTLDRATPSPLIIALEPVVTNTELEEVTLPDL